MSERERPRGTVSYTRMEDGTAEDYRLLRELGRQYSEGTADRILNYLPTLKTGALGQQIDGYQHLLQTATRAYREGADEETVVAALLHDIGESLAPENHSEFAASILQPYVRSSTHWMIAHHGIFQGYYYFHHWGRDRNERDRFRGHPDFERTVCFCARWDQTSFDPAYDTMPLAAFEPMVRRIFAREPWSVVTR
jgi:predicted HD phosphohydrolase